MLVRVSMFCNAGWERERQIPITEQLATHRSEVYVCGDDFEHWFQQCDSHGGSPSTRPNRMLTKSKVDSYGHRALICMYIKPKVLTVRELWSYLDIMQFRIRKVAFELSFAMRIASPIHLSKHRIVPNIDLNYLQIEERKVRAGTDNFRGSNQDLLIYRIVSKSSILLDAPASRPPAGQSFHSRRRQLISYPQQRRELILNLSLVPLPSTPHTDPSWECAKGSGESNGSKEMLTSARKLSSTQLIFKTSLSYLEVEEKSRRVT
ncbi:hypothetical protein VNO77_03313 [Canavalia gladiata]|uniref:Uncharacterized protein n=1 Tax=Canavalia gladiata TaxID=3824 RepID=A0AAN9R813_CANGL